MFQPLADLLRPTTLDDFVGQEHILGPGKILRRMIEKDKISSLLLFGPSGCGKSALAHIIANRTKAEFISLNATESGSKDLKEALKKAEERLSKQNKRTIIFTDEVHRAAKNVQDVLLPAVEDGTVSFIGATTQNPYFSVNGPLISRSQLFEFKPLTKSDLEKILESAIKHYSGRKISFEDGVKDVILERCGGDARKLINVVEIITETTDGDVIITKDEVSEIIPRKHVVYGDDESFDMLSALQNSIQASDVHSSIYWLAWAINRGEDLNVICRRMLVTAAEDVSISDPRVLPYVNAACQAAERVGFPEASIILSAAVAYMAMTPRSKAAANAIWEALALDKEASKEVPASIKDCHYAGAKKLGRGACHDGWDLDAYESVIDNLFKPVVGLEVKLMEYNREYWKK